MKILYIAKHDSGGNDDEGAISFALESLGHKVFRVREDFAEKDLEWCRGWDFCLFHKWYNLDLMKKIECPKAFWYFDLVDWPQDATLSSRCESRKRWMAEITPLVDIGLLSDGNWVERWNEGHRGMGRSETLMGKIVMDSKLHVLRQGADERVVGFGKAVAERDIDILFPGIGKGGGVQRESFVADLRMRYGSRLYHVPRGLYGRELANFVARSKVVVCPDSPVTDRYWSNRVYVLGGFGACLLHPTAGKEIPVGVLTYTSREDLFAKIDLLLSSSSLRGIASSETLDEVKEKHLYRHRCEELVRVVKERLNLG